MGSRKLMRIAMVQVTLFVLIVGTLWMFTPELGEVQTTGKVTFFSFENAHEILIDDNPSFTSPTRVNDGAVRLEPGTYYWKAVGIFGDSEVGNFTIASEVVISMQVSENGTRIINQGNVPVDIQERSKGSISGNIIVDVDDSQDFITKNEVIYEASET